tara:strand:+ start:45 stop:353 length:309 start_codon:yes stop_codon:yes gene_type:complete
MDKFKLIQLLNKVELAVGETVMSKKVKEHINELILDVKNEAINYTHSCSVICRFLFIYVDGDYKLIKYVEANNQDEAEIKADNGWVRVVELEEDMQIVYNDI